MLHLPNITLFAIDCVTPEKTIAAMRYSMRWVKFGAAILITDTLRNAIDCTDIEVIHREETDDKVSPIGMPGLNLPVAYELDVLRLPAEYLRTSHMLHVEWDSAVLNPLAWTDDFLDYDYIGAPWPPHHDPGWPACDESNNVGNGGFALKSQKFCKMIRRATDEFRDDNAMVSSDRWQCRTVRPWMEKQGVVYAHETVASLFSCEGRIYTGAFGFHGTSTVEANGWSGNFFSGLVE